MVNTFHIKIPPTYIQLNTTYDTQHNSNTQYMYINMIQGKWVYCMAQEL